LQEVNLITLEKIEEWIQEVEARPSSAPHIIRFIANRLSDLSKWNEELLDDNIQLRTGQRVEEYERKIANLEYQLALLKRQIGDDSESQPDEAFSLVVYNARGQVLKVTLNHGEWDSTARVACFRGPLSPTGPACRLLLTSELEELLFLYDTGRTLKMPVSAIPASDGEGLDWQEAYLQEPRGIEDLAAIIPIARMSLFEFCIQTSRRGFTKRILETAFEAHLAKDYVGSGVKLQSDKTCNLTLCEHNDLFVMVSREGHVLSIAASRLPMTIEQAIRLGPDDHIITSFIQGQKPAVLFITQNGKAIHRETSWLEEANSLKTRGQPIFSRERRETGARVVAAAPLSERDWGVSLQANGEFTAHQIADLFTNGSLFQGKPSIEVVGFAACAKPDRNGHEH
jgi:DNA gyrase/topoisomerase IV subunit A